MTDHEYEALVTQLERHYGDMKSGDEVAAHYAAVSHTVGLQTPEDHAAELFLATAAGTWVNAYGFFARRTLYLVVAQLLALAAGYHYQLSTANLLLLAPALTVAFALLQLAIRSFASVGAKYLQQQRSLPVQEFIERAEERSKGVLDSRLAEANQKRKE